MKVWHRNENVKKKLQNMRCRESPASARWAQTRQQILLKYLPNKYLHQMACRRTSFATVTTLGGEKKFGSLLMRNPLLAAVSHAQRQRRIGIRRTLPQPGKRVPLLDSCLHGGGTIVQFAKVEPGRPPIM
jgi:hypothetical protein